MSNPNEEIIDLAESTSAEAEKADLTPAEPKKKRTYKKKEKKEAAPAEASEKPRRGRPKKNLVEVAAEVANDVVEKVEKAAAKKPARAKKAPAPKKEETARAEVAPEFYVQADGLDISYEEVLRQVKSVISGEYSSLKIYLNLNEKKVYAVVDERINVNFPIG